MGTAWSADGRYVYFVSLTNRQARMALWRVSSDGGEPETVLRLPDRNISTPHVAPDGRHIAFTAALYRSEIWALKNLLPELKASR
jgi:Tol biopolymer transport system component